MHPRSTVGSTAAVGCAPTRWLSSGGVVVDAVSRVVVDVVSSAAPASGSTSSGSAPPTPSAASPAASPALRLYNDAILAASAGDDVAARSALKEALGLDPAFAPASIELGLLMLKGKDMVGAFPHLVAAHGSLSGFREAHPGFGAAGEDGSAAVDLDTKTYAMHVGLAEVYRTRGDTQMQRTHLEHR